MVTIEKGNTNRLLGHPDDARLLIINADDFGMCHSINEAITGTLRHGMVRSTSLMMPCSCASHALHVLREHPDIAFGVHLTVICDTASSKYGPLLPVEKVPSLIGETGYFYNFELMSEFLAQARMDELEAEFTAQIEAVLAAGLKPTHLDWHCLRLTGRSQILDLILRLAKAYGLALRVVGPRFIEQVQSQGLPCNDYDFLDSFGIDLVKNLQVTASCCAIYQWV
jgi:predicted glycoside hydrolase/deacetylase ChbG (UPF0249 family)